MARRRIFLGLFSFAALLAAGLGALLVSASDDGRLNPLDHVGGNAVYCVDGGLNPATSYTGGGIRVLNGQGAERLFVPVAVIETVGEPAENTLLGESDGLALYRLGGFPWYFQLNGVDEQGKDFAFQWLGCQQAIPALPTPTATAIKPTSTYDPCLFSQNELQTFC